MRIRYWRFRRGGIYYAHDNLSGQQSSPRTKSARETNQLLLSKNQAAQGPLLNRELGCILAHINGDFVRHGPIDPHEFFALEDVTNQVSVLSRDIETRLDEMFQTIRPRQHPDIAIGPHCDDPYLCPLRDMCWSFLPEQNVLELNRGEQKGFVLLGQGIMRTLTLLTSIRGGFGCFGNLITMNWRNWICRTERPSRPSERG